QFLLYTNWMLPHITEQAVQRTLAAPDAIGLKVNFLPLPADKGYHWSVPRYDGQTMRECDLLPGGKCYYDGSGLNAEETFGRLLREGSEGVWKDLEEFYHELAQEKAA